MRLPDGGWFFAGFAGASLVAAGIRFAMHRRVSVSAVHLRGRALQAPVLRADEAIADEDVHATTTLRWGRHGLPARAAHGHFACIGATGSGKTILQRLLMQSVLPEIGSGLGNRALVYDAKQDVLSILRGMRLRCPVRLFHPMDVRAAAWDMAKDITAPNAALQMAAMLIPQSSKDTNPFFSNAARHLLFGVLLTFIRRAPGAWSFRQVLLAVRDSPVLRLVLSQEEATRHLLQYFEHEGTFQNIVSTILTCTAPYETIAASWDRASAGFSLRSWMSEESILVLGNDEANRVAVDTLNRLVFQRLTELVLGLPESTTVGRGQTWFFLDEVREMGRLDGLSRLLTKGRSKGAAVVLGLQDVCGLRDVYGREVAEELLGQCNTKVILRLNSPETAAWASKLFGTREVVESSRNLSRSRATRPFGFGLDRSSGESISNGITRREVVLDSEFMDLPETNPETGLSGFFLSPTTGAFRDTLPGTWIARNLLPADRSIPDSQPPPESHQYLRHWCDADVEELRLDTTSAIGGLRVVRGAS